MTGRRRTHRRKTTKSTVPVVPPCQSISHAAQRCVSQAFKCARAAGKAIVRKKKTDTPDTSPGGSCSPRDLSLRRCRYFLAVHLFPQLVSLLVDGKNGSEGDRQLHIGEMINDILRCEESITIVFEGNSEMRID